MGCRVRVCAHHRTLRANMAANIASSHSFLSSASPSHNQEVPMTRFHAQIMNWMPMVWTTNLSIDVRKDVLGRSDATTYLDEGLGFRV